MTGTPYRRGALTPRIVRIVLIVSAIALAGCAFIAPGPEADPALRRLDPTARDQQSLVYGYLDMADAPTELDWVEFRQVSPPTATPFFQMRIHEGVFYMEKFPRGVFEMGEFGGRRWDGQSLAYHRPRSSPALRVSIERPGLHYVGAYRYRPVREPGAGAERFEIDRIDAPSEAEVLGRILPHAQDSPWHAAIRARLQSTR